MRFNFRKRVRIWPFVFNFGTRGFTGWGIKVWRYSWSARTRRHTFDTPGPGSVTWGGKK